MTTNTTSGAWFATPDEYTAAQQCPVCKADSGEPCLTKRIEVHSARVSAGIDHYNRDIGSAPWTDERIPGVSYSTI